MVSARHRFFVAQEAAKAFVLNQVRRRGYDITRGPFSIQLQRILTTQGIDSVLDIGANIGQYGSGLRSAGFSGRIVSCEPQSTAFATLAARAAKDPTWDVVRTAAGAEQSTLTINISANSYSSSFLRTAPLHLQIDPASRVVETEDVPVTTVDTLLRSHELRPERTLLKIDTQGYEQFVLDGAAEGLATMAAVQLELSLATLYEGQQLFEQMLSRLSRLGFSVHALDPAFFHPSTGQLLWCDGIFVRGD